MKIVLSDRKERGKKERERIREKERDREKRKPVESNEACNLPAWPKKRGGRDR